MLRLLFDLGRRSRLFLRSDVDPLRLPFSGSSRASTERFSAAHILIIDLSLFVVDDLEEMGPVGVDEFNHVVIPESLRVQEHHVHFVLRVCSVEYVEELVDRNWTQPESLAE